MALVDLQLKMGTKSFIIWGSTFSNFTIMPEIAAAKIREDALKVCYIGCGVTTGLGAVMNTAKVEEGSRTIVFGLGGIGLNVIQGLRMAGCDQIVGVDINPSKVEMAKRFDDRFCESIGS